MGRRKGRSGAFRVSLQMSGPDVSDLTFCNLPGGPRFSFFLNWLTHSVIE